MKLLLKFHILFFKCNFYQKKFVFRFSLLVVFFQIVFFFYLFFRLSFTNCYLCKLCFTDTILFTSSPIQTPSWPIKIFLLVFMRANKNAFSYSRENRPKKCRECDLDNTIWKEQSQKRNLKIEICKEKKV